MKDFISLDLLKEKIERDGKLTIRPSSIQQFLGCPAQWFRAQILQDFQRPAAAATAGTSLHKGAEVGYSEKIKSGSLPPLSVLTDAVTEEWKKLNSEQDLEYGKDENFNTYEKDLVQGMKDYYTEIMPEADVIDVEKRYTVNIKDHPVFANLSGSIDAVIKGGIADIKFTKRKTSADKYTLQQSAYMLLRQLNGEECNFLEIHNVIRGKGVEVMPLKGRTDYVRSVLNMILDTTRTFYETGCSSLFRGTNSHAFYLCSEQWCGYWNKCPYVKDLRS